MRRWMVFLVFMMLVSSVGAVLSTATSSTILKTASLSDLTLVMPYTCTDSDGGMNLAVKGKYYSKASRSYVEDACEYNGSAMIWETVCTPGCNCDRMLEPCAFGTYCQNSTCSKLYMVGDDSDTLYDREYEMNIFKKGNTRYFNGQQSYTDSCVDSMTVREYGPTNMYADIKCPEGTSCADGECVGEVNCFPLFPGYNKVGERRYGVVFVGTDYHDVYSNHSEAVAAFVRDAKRSIGLEGNSYGLLSIEPFKSDADKFNFWYVDRFVDAVPFAAVNGTMTPAEVERRQTAERSQRGTASACRMGHKIVVSLDAVGGWNTAAGNLINFGASRYRPEDFPTQYSQCVSGLDNCYNKMLNQTQRGNLPIIDKNNDGCIFGFDELRYAKSYDICQSVAFYRKLCANTSADNIKELCTSNTYLGEGLAHEMSHIFGLLDESVGRDADKILNVTSTRANCAVASSVDECKNTSLWKWFMGNGCGQPGVIDCIQTDLDYNKEIVCHKGCIGGVNSYRSVRYSIMPYGYALQGVSSDPTHELGEWNAYYLDKKIKAYLEIGDWFFY